MSWNLPDDCTDEMIDRAAGGYECCPIHGPGNDPEDCELCAEDREIPPSTESRFVTDGYYRRAIGRDESRADDLDVDF